MSANYQICQVQTGELLHGDNNLVRVATFKINKCGANGQQNLLWFAQIEVDFHLCNITVPTIMYYHFKPNLRMRLYEFVYNIIEYSSSCYKDLKRAIL